MKRAITLLLFLLCVDYIWGQSCVEGVINDFAPVSGFGCDSSILKVGTTNGFSPGDKVLLIQMKGAAIDLSNTANFGNITNPGTCGNYEFNRIKSIFGNEIHLKFHLSRSYDIAGKIQLVRVPEYENATTCNVFCNGWNGSTGGVIVLEVKEKLTLTGPLVASQAGLRGGVADDANASVYHLTDFFYPADPLNAAAKGESIASIPVDKSYGRGKSANSGGGGNAHNAGGGGGANGGNGGNGGLEYYNTPSSPTPGTNGVGGLAFFPNDPNKITLGGSGGAGHMNDLVGSNGGIGGGIIILKAKHIESSGGILFTNGGNILGGPENNDGQGGGGAGGTIAIECQQLTGTLPCELRGGRGGDCLFHVPSQIIGPGGGAGGGRLLLSSAFPNITASLLGGIQGVANQSLFNGAESGQDGLIITGLVLPQDTIPAFSAFAIETDVTPPICADLFSGIIEVLNTNATSFSLNGGTFQSSPIFSGLQPGNYQVALRLANGCILDTSVFLSSPSPIAGVATEVQGISCKHLGKVSASPGSGVAPFEFNLNGGTLQADSVFNYLDAGVYTLAVQDAQGCIGTTTFEIAAYIALEIQLDSLKNTNCTNRLGTLTVSAFGGISPYSFQLENLASIQNTGFFDGLTPGNYQVIVTDRDTCETRLDGLVIREDTATSYVHELLSLCQNDFFTLPDGRVVDKPGLYAMVIPKTNGCDSTLVYEIGALPSNYFIPNAFLPDDDGENDFFSVFATPDCFRAVKLLRIFDRWGELVFERYNFPPNDEQLGWDGTFRRKAALAGVYIYYLELEYYNGAVEKKKGSVTLVR